MLGIAPACRPRQPPTATYDSQGAEELQRVFTLQRFVFAYEANDLCSLEVAKLDSANQVGQWRDFRHTDLVGVPFDVVGRTFEGGVLQLSATTKSEPGSVFAFRNRPTAPKTVARSWNCAVDTGKVTNIDYEPAHKYVRLATESCSRLSPILGTREELTLSPYTVIGRGVFVAQASEEGSSYRQAEASVAHLIEAMGGRKRLWVSSTDLEACFSASDREPPQPNEEAALLSWLGGEEPDAVDPPDVSYETVTALTGITKDRCKEEEFRNGKTGLVCNAPLIRLAADEDPNAFGQRGLTFVQDRAVSGLYFQNGRLVSPLSAVNKEVAVTVSGASWHFSSALKEALQPTIEDETKRRQRASSGRYELLSEADRRKATHVIQVNLEREIPDVEVTEEPREHRYVSGTKTIANAEYEKADEAVSEATEHLAAVIREGQVERQRMKVAQAACSSAGGELAAQGAGKVAEQIPFAGGLFSGAAKKAAKETVAAGCAETANAMETKIGERLAAAKQALAKAKAKFAETPEELEVPNEKIHTYVAKTYRRSGVAKARIVVRDKRRRKLFEETVSVPFETTDLEIPDVPEVDLEGKKASPPSAADVEDALSASLVPKIESTIVRWSTEQIVGESVGDAKRGTRSWAALVASEAATNRPAKLLMDILENRNVASGSARIPVSFPEDAGKKCFTFTASDAEGKANVDLVLRADGDYPIARDRRRLVDAAFELCSRAAGKYELEVLTEPGEARAILVSLFESTPGSYKADELARSTKGSPHSPLEDDVFVLDASGQIRAKSTGGTVVVGRLGDRDGDGVSDDDDRCPYEVETENYFLDNDGCPDEPPSGFVPDPDVVKAIDAKRAAAIAAGTASQAQLEAVERKKAAERAEEQAKLEEAARKRAQQEALAQKRAEADAAQKQAALEREKAARALAEAEAARKAAEQQRLLAQAERKKAEEERKRAEEDRRKAEEAKEAEEAKKAEKDRETDKDKVAAKEDEKEEDDQEEEGDKDGKSNKKKETEIYIP